MNRSQGRRPLALLIAHTPTNALRRAFYTLLMGYRFGAGARLGWGSVIAVDRFLAGADVTLRRGNRFIGPITVELGDRTFIGRANRIDGGDEAADAKVAHMGYNRRFVTGADTLINEGRRFDVHGALGLRCRVAPQLV